MPQVSKRVVSKQVEEKIIETFLEALSQLRNKKDILLFINDLLYPVERIMLAKRLAIAVLLIKGWNYESINNMVKVSNDTISRVSVAIKTNKGYKIASDKLSQTEAVREFWQDLHRLAYRLGVPGRAFADDYIIKRRLGQKSKTLL